METESLRQLKKGDKCMVRNIKNGRWNHWVQGTVINCYKEPKYDVLEVGYVANGIHYKVLSSRFNGIVRSILDSA